MRTPADGINEGFKRGYGAAKTWAETNTPPGEQYSSVKIRSYRDQLKPLSVDYSRGWDAFCDEVKAAEDALAYGHALFRRRKMKDRLAQVLTWALFAAAIALVVLYAWSYYIGQADRAAEKQRLADLAGRVEWLGSIDTSRWSYEKTDSVGRPTRMLTLYNPQYEIGLKPDGTVIWRKLPAAQRAHK